MVDHQASPAMLPHQKAENDPKIGGLWRTFEKSVQNTPWII